MIFLEHAIQLLLLLALRPRLARDVKEVYYTRAGDLIERSGPLSMFNLPRRCAKLPPVKLDTDVFYFYFGLDCVLQ